MEEKAANALEMAAKAHEEREKIKEAAQGDLNPDYFSGGGEYFNDGRHF